MYEITIRGVVVRCLDLASVLLLIEQVRELDDAAAGHRLTVPQRTTPPSGTRDEDRPPRRTQTRRKQDRTNGHGGEPTPGGAAPSAAAADRARVLEALRPNQNGITVRDLKRILQDMPTKQRSQALFILKRDHGVVKRGNLWYHPDHADAG